MNTGDKHLVYIAAENAEAEAWRVYRKAADDFVRAHTDLRVAESNTKAAKYIYLASTNDESIDE